MIDSTKACILSAYAPGTSHGLPVQGSPYKRGQERLKRSLIHHGFRYDIKLYQDFITNDFNRECGYNIKADALQQVIKEGYERILWLDSSVWAVRPVEPLFDYIDSNGWYFHSNGFNLRQTADDNALDYFGISPNLAWLMPDLSSSMFGLHMGNPKAQEWAKLWIQSAKDGLWNTSREHANGSEDPRYMFDRQDQTAATALMHKLNMNMVDRGVYSMYANDNGIYPESVCLVMRGL